MAHFAALDVTPLPLYEISRRECDLILNSISALEALCMLKTHAFPSVFL